MPIEPPGPFLVPSSRPDEQAFRFPTARPAMPASPAGAPPLAAARWVEGRRRLERQARRQGEYRGSRTDLAVEAHRQVVEQAGGAALEGVESTTERAPHATIDRVAIRTPEAARAMGKAQGTYVTIQSPALRDRSMEAKEAVGALVAREVGEMLRALGVGPNDLVLIAGLGNWNATPDSLGPRVVGQVLVTRHLHQMLPPEKKGQLRPVAAVSPGVLGLTGVETTELVAAMADRIRPAAVVCVDALAASAPDRLCTTVQISDAGIQPGAGVGNLRMGLNREALGLPVIALGMPTVIQARRLGDWAPPLPVARGRLGRRFPALLRDAAAQAGMMEATPAAPLGAGLDGMDAGWIDTLIVTPKEIDVFIDDASEVIAGGLNDALHPGLQLDEVLSALP